MNVITLTGINQRMESRTTKSGGVMVTGTIRVRNAMKNMETGQYDSSFIDYKVIGNRAPVFADYQREKAELHITGHIVQESWEKDGQKRSKLVVMVQDFDLPKREEATQGNAFNATPPIGEINPDSLPF